MKVWDAGQLRQFLEEIANHRLYAAFYVLATTGMRRGEVLGLRWSDVDSRHTPGLGGFALRWSIRSADDIAVSENGAFRPGGIYPGADQSSDFGPGVRVSLCGRGGGYLIRVDVPRGDHGGQDRTACRVSSIG